MSMESSRGCIIQRDGGAALLLCMVFTGAAITAILVLSVRTVAHVRQSGHSAHAVAALAAAEASLAAAIRDFERGGSGRFEFTGTWSWSAGGLPVLSSPPLDGTVEAGPGAVSSYAVTVHRPGLPEGYRVVYAVARAGVVERRLEVVVRRRDSGAVERVTWRELRPGEWEAA